MKAIMTYESHSAPFRRLVGEEEDRYRESTAVNLLRLRTVPAALLSRFDGNVSPGHLARAVEIVRRVPGMQDVAGRNIPVFHHVPGLGVIDKFFFNIGVWDDHPVLGFQILTKDWNMPESGGRRIRLRVDFMEDDYIYVDFREFIVTKGNVDKSYLCDGLRGLSALVEHIKNES